MATVSFLDSNNDDRDILFRQFICQTPLAAGQTINGSQAIKFQIRAQEGSPFNNMFTAIGIRIIDADGITVNKTILAVTRDGTEISDFSLVNCRFTANSAAGDYTTVSGDRLVIEIGTGGSPLPLGHDSDLRIGDASASDLPEDDSSTSDYNPWVEFTNILSFGGTTHQAEASLASTAVVSPVASVNLLATTAVSGLATLAPVATLVHAAVAVLAGVAGLTADAEAGFASAILTASSTFDSAASMVLAGAAAVSGTGALDPLAVVTYTVAAALLGMATLTPAADVSTFVEGFLGHAGARDLGQGMGLAVQRAVPPVGQGRRVV